MSILILVSTVLVLAQGPSKQQDQNNQGNQNSQGNENNQGDQDDHDDNAPVQSGYAVVTSAL
jgi:hypothetical protein